MTLVEGRGALTTTRAALLPNLQCRMSAATDTVLDDVRRQMRHMGRAARGMAHQLDRQQRQLHALQRLPQDRLRAQQRRGAAAGEENEDEDEEGEGEREEREEREDSEEENDGRNSEQH